MPIVEIRALPQSPPVDEQAVLARVCRDLAKVDGCPERQVWATWEEIPAGRFVEGDVPVATQPRDTHPPMVRVMAMEGRPPEKIAAMLECVCRSVAAMLPIDPDNVFARYDELRRGRVAWGGDVQT